MEALKPSKLTNRSKYSNVKSKVGSVRKASDVAMKPVSKPPVPAGKRAPSPSRGRSEGKVTRSTSKTRVTSASPSRPGVRARTPQKKKISERKEPAKPKEAATPKPEEPVPEEPKVEAKVTKPPTPARHTPQKQPKKLTLEYIRQTKYPNPLAGGVRPGPLIPATDPNAPPCEKVEDDMYLSDDSELPTKTPAKTPGPTKTPAKTPMSRQSPFAVSPFTESPFCRIRTPAALKVSTALLLSTPNFKAPLPIAPQVQVAVADNAKASPEKPVDVEVETEVVAEAVAEEVPEPAKELVMEDAEDIVAEVPSAEPTALESTEDVVTEQAVPEVPEAAAVETEVKEAAAEAAPVEAEVETEVKEAAAETVEATPEVVPEVTEPAAPEVLEAEAEEVKEAAVENVAAKRKHEPSEERVEEEHEPSPKRRSLSVEEGRTGSPNEALATVESTIPDFPVSECSSETSIERARRHEESKTELMATIEKQGHGTVTAVQVKRTAEGEGDEPSPKKQKTTAAKTKPSEESKAAEEPVEEAMEENKEEEEEEELTDLQQRIADMTYRQLQQECKKNGMKASGKRDKLEAALLAKLSK